MHSLNQNNDSMNELFIYQRTPTDTFQNPTMSMRLKVHSVILNDE